jgi:hypothetical protein
VREATGLSVVARCRRGRLQLRSRSYSHSRDIDLVDVECEIDRQPGDQRRNALMQRFVREVVELLLEAQAMRSFVSASESDPTRTGRLDDPQQTAVRPPRPRLACTRERTHHSAHRRRSPSRWGRC